MIHGATGIVLVLLPAESFWMSPITADLAWLGHARLVAMPFLVVAALKGLGLYLNVSGRPLSRLLRSAGAVAGGFIWIWYMAKFSLILARPGLAFVPLEVTIAQTMAMALCLTGALFSVRILALALANLPRPGAPGQF